MKKRKRLLSLAIALCTILASLPYTPVLAATDHAITYYNGNSELSSTSIGDGNTLGSLPVVSNLITWVVYDSGADPITVDENYVPTADLSVYAITTDQVTANGTLDSGNIIWYIADGKLYVTGEGTITLNTRSSYDTKYYGTTISDADDIAIAKLAKLYENIVPTAVGDEITTGYGNYTSDTMVLGIDVDYEASFTNQTTHYAATSLADAVPWSNYADQLTDIYFSSQITMDGNFTSYFNVNSTDIYNVKKSIYTNVANIYMYSDTSAVTSQSIMYAGMPKLEHVYTKAGNTYDTSSTVDMSGMFYGDESLLTVSKDPAQFVDILNVFSDTQYVKDMSYLCFDCQKISSPAISNWDTSALQDLSYAFFGCNNAALSLDGSKTATDMSGWDMDQVFSISFAFCGADIDTIYGADNAISIPDLWECEEKKNVVTGALDLNKWSLDLLQEAVYTFANNKDITSVKWTNSVPYLKDTSLMFAFTPGLTSVDLNGLNTPQLAYIIGMFYEAGISGSCDFSNWTNAIEDARLAFYGTGFSTMNFDDTSFSKLIYGDYMFAENKSLTSLGSGALSDADFSALTCALGMFMDDALLTTINMSTWSMENCDTAAYMFKGCKSLRSIDLSGWDTKKITTIENMADGCYSVTALNLTGLDFSALTDAHRAFADMTSLLTFNAAGVNFPVLVEANGMLAGDSSLKTVVLSGTFPALKDAAGMFYNNISLETVNVPNLSGTTTEDLSYMFFGNSSLTSMDISNWDTSKVAFFQSFLEGASSLENVTFPSGFTTVSALDTGKMFKGDVNLSDETLQAFLTDSFLGTVLEDAYEMFYKAQKLTLLDLTGKTFASLSNMTRMFAEDPLLTVISLPADFMSAVTSTANATNVFYETNTTPTTLTVDADTLPATLAAYSWAEDNRTFLTHDPATINDVETTSLVLTTDTTEADMGIHVASTFYLKKTPLAITYEWAKGTSNISGAATNTYATTAEGTYRAVADIAALTGDNTIADTFTITDGSTVIKMDATYIGPDIIKGENYEKRNVQVTITRADDSTQTLTVDDFSVDSLAVNTVGENTYVVSYTDEKNTTWTDDITVNGYREIGSISAVYTGPQVVVGNDYNTDYVSLTAYYRDDTTKSQGFPVTLTSVSSKMVNNDGTNTYTAYYKDPYGTMFSDTFTVTGYVPSVSIVSATAEYKGPDIAVGSNYDKTNVMFTLTYSDGSTATVSGFVVDSILVNNEGANEYTATYSTNGTSYSAKFTVNGISTSKAASAANATTNTTKVKTGDNNPIWLWIIAFIASICMSAGAGVWIIKKKR